MAAEESLWWSQEFPSYSLAVLEKLPIYQELMKWVNTGVREKDAYWTKMNSTDTSRSIIKRSLNHTRSESLHLDQASNTWVWELSEKKARYDLKSVANKQGEKQWGQVIKRFPAYLLEETWKVEGEEKTYEQVRVENGLRRSHRPGLGESIRQLTGDSVDFSSGLNPMFESHSPISSSDRVHTEPFVSPKNRQSLGVGASSFWEDTRADASPVWDTTDSLRWEERLSSRSFKGPSTGFRLEEDREEWGGRRSMDTSGVGPGSLENLCDREWEGTVKSLEIVESLSKDPQETKSLWSKMKTMEEQLCVSPADWLRRIHELRDMQDYLNEAKISLLRLPTAVFPAKEVDSKAGFAFSEEQVEVFFPNFLTAKFLDDLSHFQRLHSPRTLPEFLPIYLQQAGIGPHTSEVLESLQAWREKGNKRAAVLCDLLLGPEAVSYLLSLFVIRARMEFGRMAKGETAALLDILRFTTLLFGPEKASSQEAALALKPASHPSQDFSPIAQRLRSSAFRASISGVRVTEEEFVASLIETGRKKEKKGATAAGQTFDRAEKTGTVTVQRLEELLLELEPGMVSTHLQAVLSCCQNSSTSLSKATFQTLLRYYPFGPAHHSVFSNP